MRDKSVRMEKNLKLMKQAFKEFSKSTNDDSQKTLRYGSKLAVLVTKLRELNTDKIIVFAAFKGTVTITKEVLRRAQIDVLTLEGALLLLTLLFRCFGPTK